MSEKLNSSPIEDRIGNFAAKREENDTKAYYESLIGDAGDTDTSDEAYDRLVEAQTYDSHMAASKYVFDDTAYQQEATPEAMPTMAEVFSMATKAREAEAIGDRTVANDMVAKIDETLENMTYEGELSVEQAQVIMQQIVANIESAAPNTTTEQPRETQAPQVENTSTESEDSEKDAAQEDSEESENIPQETEDKLTEQQIKEFDRNKKEAGPVAQDVIDQELFDFDRNRNELYTDFNQLDTILRAKDAAAHNDKSTVHEIFNNTRNRLDAIVAAGGMTKEKADAQFKDFKSLVGFEESSAEVPRYTAESPADTSATEVIKTPTPSEQDSEKTDEEKLFDEIDKTHVPTDEEIAELGRVGEDLGADDEKKPAKRKLRERLLSRAAIKNFFGNIASQFTARYKDEEASKPKAQPKPQTGFAQGKIAQFRRNQRRRKTELKLQDKKLQKQIDAKREEERKQNA
jgi:hypothetical protein